MKVGLIGLGLMGRGMAKNLVKAGHDVQAWNRSPTEPIEGVAIVGTPADVFDADAVLTMLSDDAAIRSVLATPDIFAKARRGCVHVVMATISVAFAEELAAQHARAGLDYVSAPVFGRPDVAEAAQLAIMAAGKPEAIERVRPIFEAVGRKTWVLGQEPKAANAAKIGGNMMLAVAIESMAEASALAERNGLDPKTFLDLMLETQFGGSRAYANYSAKLISKDFEPGFRMRLGLKDLGLAVAASGAGAKLPVLAALNRQMTEAVEAGLGDKDWCAVAELLSKPAT